MDKIEDAYYCDVCGKLMKSGYVINEGEEYYCSDECLSTRYRDNEFDELYEAGDSYWTEFN